MELKQIKLAIAAVITTNLSGCEKMPAAQPLSESKSADAIGSESEVVLNKTIEGDGLYFQGRFQEAIKPYELALSLAPTSRVCHYNLAIALLRTTKHDADDTADERIIARAIALLNKALSLPAEQNMLDEKLRADIAYAEGLTEKH